MWQSSHILGDDLYVVLWSFAGWSLSFAYAPVFVPWQPQQGLLETFPEEDEACLFTPPWTEAFIAAKSTLG